MSKREMGGRYVRIVCALAIATAIMVVVPSPLFAPVKGEGVGGRQLTTNPQADVEPDWSPDGSAILYTIRPEGQCCSAKLWRMDSDGIAHQQFSYGTLDEAADFRPDGGRIVFLRWPSTRGDYNEVMLANPDGSGIVQISSGGSLTYGSPRWSHDGNRIVGHSIIGSTGTTHVGTHRLWIMNGDGSGLTIIYSSGYFPVLFPGDAELVFTDHNYEETDFHLAILSLVDDTAVPITAGPYDWYPDVSPDGSRIVFSRCAAYPSSINVPCDLYMMNRDGSNLIRLTDDGTQNLMPRFSPDGRRIAYVSSRSGNRDIWVMDVTILVSVDIKPGSYPNSINMKNNGVIPVAVLSSPDFDAPGTVDRESLTFGHTGDEHSLKSCAPGGEDVNFDGLPDLVCHFYTQLTDFLIGDTQGVLRGQTLVGMSLEGSDSVRIIA